MRMAPALAALAACAPSAEAPAPPSPFALVPAAGGLSVTGSGGREIGFGRDRPGALRTVARIEGRMPASAPCAAPGLEAFRTRDGLDLIFTATSFVGWRNGPAAAGRACG